MLGWGIVLDVIIIILVISIFVWNYVVSTKLYIYYVIFNTAIVQYQYKLIYIIYTIFRHN